MLRIASMLTLLRRFRLAGLALLATALLLPLTGSGTPRTGEAAWLEGDWPKAFATPRPTLPGQSAWLEGTRPIPLDLRVRIHRVKNPDQVLRKLLGGPVEEGLYETSLAGYDPFDVLREAILWGGRRGYVTVQRTATRGLRDTVKEITRFHRPRSSAQEPRVGHALPLKDNPDLELVAELAPTSPKDQPNAIELPPQPAGVYIVECLSEEETAYVPWMVTDLTLLGDEDGGTLRVSAVQARDGASIPGATYRLYDAGVITDLKPGIDGNVQVDATPGTRRVVWASQGASHALMAIEGTAAASARQRVYAYTERPLYKPGQDVHFKAFVRRVSKGANVVPKTVNALFYQVVDAEGQAVTKGEARLLNAATASYGGDFDLPEAAASGLYRILIQGLDDPAMAEFKVEHFIKPTFTVAVETPSARAGLGDDLPFKIQAKYFTGAPLKGAKADWFLYVVKPARFSPWGDDAGPVPTLKESGQVELDGKGEANLEKLKAKEEGLWRLVVKVEDESAQRNQGVAQVRCAKGDLVLLVETDRELIAPNQPFKASVRVLDLDGKEVSGIPVVLKACTLEKKPGVDGWVWSSQHRPGVVLSQGQGPVASLTIPTPGLHLVVAEATDRSGRKIEALRPVTVVAEGSPLPLTDSLKAMADRREYAVGDTARLLVRLPRPNLTLRWSIENETVLERGTRKVPGTSTLVDIPIKALHQPNVWAVFEIVAEGAHQTAEVPLRVPQVDKRLEVKVQPDQVQYKPGDVMKLALEVKDFKGLPVAADLSVGVVDEAIYALSQELHPEPFRFFFPTRRHVVTHTGSTEWSFFDLMRKAKPSWALRQTKRGDFKTDDESRKNFKDTALWVPFLATDQDGRAATEVTLPDNLTSWRTTAVAMTASTQVGVGRANRPSSKPLMVSLTLPRTLALGDESRVMALVQNLSGRTLKGAIHLEIQGGQLKGPVDASFELKNKDSWRFSAPLAALATGRLSVKARVEAENLKDAELKSLTVTEATVPASVSGSVRLEGGSQSVDIPAPPKAKGSAMVVFTPVLGLESLMEPSLPYLIQYPYGCVEQTLSSFMPNVLIEDLVQHKLAPPIAWSRLKDLPKHIAEGTLRVANFQQPNGGWGWWDPAAFGGASNPHTTGYALQSLATLKRLGHPVNDAMFQRGIEAGTELFGQLAARADGSGEDAPSGYASDAAFMLLSLASAKVPVKGLLDQSAAKVLEGKWKGTQVLAMVALAAAETQHPKAQALLALLEKSATQQNGTASWAATQSYGYCSGDLIPTVNALKTLCLLDPKSPLIPAGERYLASSFRGYGWYSTWTTAQTLSLLPYLAKVRPLVWSAPPLKVQIQGGPTLDFATLKADSLSPWEGRLKSPSSYRLASPSAVRFTASGTGTLVWTYAYQVAGSAAPAQAAVSNGLELSRRLWKLQPPAAGASDGKGWVRQTWTGKLGLGEEAWMELDFGAQSQGQYGVLEVPIPAGLEPIVKLDNLVLEGHGFEEGQDKNQRVEVFPDRVCWFFPRIGPSHQKVRLWFRAALPGSYTLRPARVFLMGDETRWATCDAIPVAIKDKEGK